MRKKMSQKDIFAMMEGFDEVSVDLANVLAAFVMMVGHDDGLDDTTLTQALGQAEESVQLVLERTLRQIRAVEAHVTIPVAESTESH